MAGLANDFVADQAASAAITGFAKLGLAKGTLAAVAAPVAAGLGTVLVLGLPMLAVAVLAHKLAEAKPTGER